jgi:hypothetical protein
VALQFRDLLPQPLWTQRGGGSENRVWERPTGGRVVWVARGYMGMNMRHRIVKGRVIKLTGIVNRLNSLSNGADIAPITEHFLVGKVADIWHMSSAEDNERSSWLRWPTFEISIGPAASKETDAPLLLVRASLGTHFTIEPAALGIPVIGPGSRHVQIVPHVRGMGQAPHACAATRTER